MVTSVGHGVPELVEAARAQAARVSFLYNQQFTTRAQEELAASCSRSPRRASRASTSSRAGPRRTRRPSASRRSYHVERGEPDAGGSSRRRRPITVRRADDSLTGRPGLHHHYTPYLTPHLHIPPRRGASTRAAKPRSRRSTARSRRPRAQCPPSSASRSARPPSAYSPPATSGRVSPSGGRARLPDLPRRGGHRHGPDRDVVRGRAAPVRARRDHDRQGLGAGYAPIGAVLCREEVYRAIAGARARSSSATRGTARRFPARSGWRSSATCASTGSSSACATRARLLEALRPRSPTASSSPRCAAAGSCWDRLRRPARRLVPAPELGLARRIDVEALARGLVVYSTQPTADGYAGDQTLIAPAFTSTDEELSLIVERMAEIRAVEQEVLAELEAAPPRGAPDDRRRGRHGRALRAHPADPRSRVRRRADPAPHRAPAVGPARRCRRSASWRRCSESAAPPFSTLFGCSRRPPGRDAARPARRDFVSARRRRGGDGGADPAHPRPQRRDRAAARLPLDARAARRRAGGGDPERR